MAALGDRPGNRGSRMLGHWMSGCVTFWQGEFGSAAMTRTQLPPFTSATRNAPRRSPLQIDPVSTRCFTWAGPFGSGYADQASATSAKAIDAARGLAPAFLPCDGAVFACATRACCGQSAAVKQAGRAHRSDGAAGSGVSEELRTVLEARS